MQVKVIIGKNVVFATYYKTICFKKEFSNDLDRREAVINAQSSAFEYSCSGTSNSCSIVADEKLSTDDAVFAYLEKCHPPKVPKTINEMKKEAGEHLLDEEYWKDPY